MFRQRAKEGPELTLLTPPPHLSDKASASLGHKTGETTMPCRNEPTQVSRLDLEVSSQRQAVTVTQERLGGDHNNVPATFTVSLERADKSLAPVGFGAR